MFSNRDCIHESLSALVRLILGAALVMIGVALILLAWLYNEYGIIAFWVGVSRSCSSPRGSSGTRPLFRSTRRPSRTPLSPDPANRPFRRRAHKLGLVRLAVLSRRAVRGLSRADRGRVKAERQSPRGLWGAQAVFPRAANSVGAAAIGNKHVDHAVLPRDGRDSWRTSGPISSLMVRLPVGNCPRAYFKNWGLKARAASAARGLL
jgi:hypothetical protein